MRFRDRGIVFFCTVSLAAIVGCDGGPPPRSVQAHDCGEYFVDDGPVTVEHTFHLINEGHSELSIENVVLSCGCLETVRDCDVVAPGGSVGITVSMRFATPGGHSHSAFVRLSDGSVTTLRLSAMGRRHEELRVIPARLSLARAKAQATVQVMYICYDEVPAGPSLRAEAPDGIEMIETGRRLIEGFSFEQGRPCRWLVEYNVSASSYVGEFPATIAMAVGEDVRCEVSIE
jgi:hypothetical protein